MTDFEKWFYTEDAEKFGLYPDIRSARAAWNYQETKLKEMDEVIKMQDADLRKYEKQIESLREQLNNMEQCYIEKKKECEGLQGKSRCIKSLVEQRNLAENMLRKISVAAQKKLPTFGAALRFNDEVKEILRGAND
ncbi:hypothetical protein KTJ53_12685 [Acinetobacter variabilis]|uniref:hypothetical protein n=1 Tax=Acinetobacter variabilis TaxID=70346 RepID=UPI0021D12CBF|nr:hypothetical protein [Acinetobacter variabilis]MCU4630529.1 hypothetical protein [Acinetobacter variabilis]